MGEDAALTDEELAKMEAMALDQIGWHPSKRDVPRLIAALRASRARVKELEKELQEANTRSPIRGW